MIRDDENYRSVFTVGQEDARVVRAYEGGLSGSG
jgi:hypothetical protein